MGHQPSYFHAVQYAIEKHGSQLYGKKPYAVHLSQVEAVLVRHNFARHLLVAAWLHDLLEDTKVTGEDLKREFGAKVAAIVEAVTDEPGANRKERKAKTLPKTAQNRDAVALKLADRIANWSECLKQGDLRMTMYLEEQPAFKEALYRPGEYESMWTELKHLEGHTVEYLRFPL